MVSFVLMEKYRLTRWIHNDRDRFVMGQHT